MMFSEKDFTAEVQAIVDSAVQQKVGVKTDWLAHSIVSKHPGIHGGDKEFYVLCAFGHVKTAIRAAIRRYHPDELGHAELTAPLLTGFTYLQAVYPVDRDGESEIIPIEELSDGEIESKAAEYERMADGCRLHAAELRRYRSGRAA